MGETKITLPYATPSLNQLIRMHWGARKRLQDDLSFMVLAKSMAIPKAAPRDRRTVRITRHGPRKLDHDNLVGGCKPLVDALRGARLIHDDNPDCVRVIYTQRTASKKTARTVVVIEYD